MLLLATSLLRIQIVTYAHSAAKQAETPAPRTTPAYSVVSFSQESPNIFVKTQPEVALVTATGGLRLPLHNSRHRRVPKSWSAGSIEVHSNAQVHMALAWLRAPLAATLLLILQCSATTDACVDNNAKSSACPEAAALGARALADAPLLAIHGVLSEPARVESLTVHVPYTRAHSRPGRLLVRFRPCATGGDNSSAMLHEVEKRVEALDGIDLTHFLPGTRIVVVTLANGADAEEAAARLRLLDGAALHSPDHKLLDFAFVSCKDSSCPANQDSQPV